MTIAAVKQEIREYLKELLVILEEEVTFEIEGDSIDELYVNFVGSLYALPEEKSSLLALQHLLRTHLRQKTNQDCGIIVDVNGAVKRRRAELIRFALETAESVRQERKRIRLNPMPPHERRTIHITLANFPGVKTHSVGRGDGRRVLIEPESA